MNSESSTSPTSPDQKTLSHSSPIAESSMVDPLMEADDLTDPLTGLCPEAMHLLTEEQLREKVRFIRECRQSHLQFKAAVEARARDEVSKPKTPKMDEFSELF